MFTPAQNNVELKIRIQQNWWSNEDAWTLKGAVFLLLSYLLPIRAILGLFTECMENMCCPKWKGQVREVIGKPLLSQD
jgi:hypothetical protein